MLGKKSGKLPAPYVHDCDESVTTIGRTKKKSRKHRSFHWYSSIVTLAFLHIVTDATHFVDIRTISQNKQPGPQIVWATTIAAAWSRSQPVSAGLKPLLVTKTHPYFSQIFQCALLRIICGPDVQQVILLQFVFATFSFGTIQASSVILDH